MTGHLIVKYDAATEWCDLIHPYNRRFHDLVKFGVKPIAYRKWNKVGRRWQVHITRLPMVVLFGKRFFTYVDYSDLPDAVQIELVRQIQEAERRKQEVPSTPHPNIIRPAQAFQVLHLLPSAPPEVVRAAYKAMAALLHPDHGGDEEAFKHLQKAYEVLTKDRK